MNYLHLIISLIVPQLVGLSGVLFTNPAITTWYASLVRPSFSPPNWIFGPAWTILYLLMGVSVYLVWKKAKKSKAAKRATWLFWIHLVFNAAWTPIFFGLRNPGWALVNIIILWFLIVFLIVKFWKIHKWAAILLIPYLLWVSFATVLNYSLWMLN
ncbi:MAG: tryptophan-rich sensory protein [Parcubacteria group bacterium]|nr:tryptophan-rich sensory protein [Parcubacteria group bacterium]